MDDYIEVLCAKRETRDVRNNKGTLIAIAISCILTFMFTSLFTYTIIIDWEYAHIFFFAVLSCLIVVVLTMSCFFLDMNYSLVIDENGICETSWSHQKKILRWSDVKYIAFYEKGAVTGGKSTVIYSACVISTAVKSEKEHRRTVKKGIAAGFLFQLPEEYVAVYGRNVELTKELYEKIQNYIPKDVKENIVFEVD